MRIGRDQQDEGEVSLTPLIDVVFLLLIFFMVSTTFDKTQSIEMQLPVSETGGEKVKGEQLVLKLQEGGLYQLNDQPKTLEQLETALKEQNRSIPLVIHSHPKASSQDLVRVLDLARKLGINQVSMDVYRKPVAPAAQ